MSIKSITGYLWVILVFIALGLNVAKQGKISYLLYFSAMVVFALHSFLVYSKTPYIRQLYFEVSCATLGMAVNLLQYFHTFNRKVSIIGDFINIVVWCLILYTWSKLSKAIKNAQNSEPDKS